MPEASSSAKKTRRTLRGGFNLFRAHIRTQAKIMASIFFISTAPRPQMEPSLISPLNGSTDQSAAFAGTTSIWPCKTNPGLLESRPAIFATTFTRVGAVSINSLSIPTSDNFAAINCAIAFSSPRPSPWLTLGIRIISWHRVIVSFSNSVIWAGFNFMPPLCCILDSSRFIPLLFLS